MPAEVASLPFEKRKKVALWALFGVGLLHGALYSYGLSNPPTQMGLQLFITFTLNLGLLGWCYADSRARTIPITRFLGLALLAVPAIGVPWYFVRSRGFFPAAKAVFGLGLFAIWCIGYAVTFVACEVASGHLHL
jgi:hypothetical protein